LIAASLAEGRSELLNASQSEDTRLLVGALMKHGVHIDLDDTFRKIIVHGGSENVFGDRNSFYLGNAGTAVRFFTAYLCLHKGNFVVDGDARMRQRPIQDLMTALNRLGADVKSAHDNGCPPLGIRADGLRGGPTSVKADISSQYVSALLLIGPYCKQGIDLKLEGTPTSEGYIEMTRSVMKAFGVDAGLKVPPGRYKPATYYSEPDAAAANYFFAAAAALGGKVRVNGLGHATVQSERRFVHVLKSMGCQVEETDFYTEVTGGPLRGVDVDLNFAPDSAQTLAVTALFAEGPTTIRNVRNLRVKETDRIRALATELTKLGARVEEREDGLVVQPPKSITPAEIQSYGDHRMVMSFAVAALRQPDITLENPSCVGKSFPEFFDTLHQLGVHAKL
jgi:3-phosphoshikimate 1-carboxyvinyltransferase